MVDTTVLPTSLSHVEFHHRLAVLLACSLASALWLQTVHTRSKSPAARFTAAVPVFAANCLLPLLFSRRAEPVTVTFAAFLLTWLGNFKILAAVGGRGPLAQQQWGLLQYWVLLVLPIVPAPAPNSVTDSHRRRNNPAYESAGTALEMLSRWLLKAGVTAAVVFTLLLPGLQPFVRSCLYVLGLYTMLGVVMDGPASLVLLPLRLSLAPHFLPPWESRSLAEFWGLRWNQAAGNALRTTVYEPVVQGSWVAPQLQQQKQKISSSKQGTRQAASTAGQASDARRMLGMSASFVVSGLIHELIFWYVDGRFTSGLMWLLFFTAQAPLVLVERAVLLWLKQNGVVLPPYLRIAATLVLLMVMAHVMFFRPAETVAERFAGSMRQSFRQLATLVWK